MNLKKYAFLFLCILFPLLASAQEEDDKWVEESDIEDAELVIEKQKKLTLPRASRQFKKMTAVSRQGTSNEEVNYQLRMVNYNLQDIEPSIRVRKMQKEPLDKLYGNYIKGGIGNFLTPYLEGHFNSKRNEKYLYGLSLRHLSSRNGPVHKNNSGVGHSDIRAYGKYIFDYASLGAQLGYERRRVHFYGYDDAFVEGDIEADSIRQNFNDFAISLMLEGTGGKRSPLSYKASTDVNLFSDTFHDLSELNIDVNLSGRYDLNDESNVSFHLNPIINNNQYGSDKTNRGILKAGGAFHYLQEGLELKVGARLAYNLDSTTNLSRFGIYPDISVNYALKDVVSVFAKAEGDLRQQSFRELTLENPFLADTVTLRHTHNIADLALGVQLTPMDKLGIRLQGGYGLYKNFHYFVNDYGVDSSQFRLAFDTGTTGVFNFTGEVTVNFSNFRTMLKSTFYSYNTQDFAEAIHRPTLENNLLVTYNYRDKVFFNVDVFHVGGLQALNANGTAFDLDDIVDVSFKVDYLFSDVVSVFLSAKNLTGQEYQRYYRYPVRGINIMAGGTYAF
ncbi:MAG: hypothetical protein ACPGJS_21920 [Flammeovirgaceae bacterium]